MCSRRLASCCTACQVCWGWLCVTVFDTAHRRRSLSCAPWFGSLFQAPARHCWPKPWLATVPLTSWRCLSPTLCVGLSAKARRRWQKRFALPSSAGTWLHEFCAHTACHVNPLPTAFCASPCVMFFDEFQAMFNSRDGGVRALTPTGGHPPTHLLPTTRHASVRD